MNIFKRKPREKRFDEKLQDVEKMTQDLENSFLFFGHQLPEDLYSRRQKILADAKATKEMLENMWKESTRAELVSKFNNIEDKLREYRVLK